MYKLLENIRFVQSMYIYNVYYVINYKLLFHGRKLCDIDFCCLFLKKKKEKLVENNLGTY